MYLFWWHLKSEWVCGWFNSAPAYEACVHRDAFGGVKRRKQKRQVCDGTTADTIMASLLYYLSPWRPRALCAACVQSPRRSFLCSWTAVGSGVCSKIRLEELQRSRGCQEERSQRVTRHTTVARRKIKNSSKLYIVTWVWHCSACSRNMLNGRQGCLQPISPLGRRSSHMMHILPFEH